MLKPGDKIRYKNGSRFNHGIGLRVVTVREVIDIKIWNKEYDTWCEIREVEKVCDKSSINNMSVPYEDIKL